MSDGHDNRRHHHRINYNTPVIIRQNDREWHTLVIDLSTRGLLIWLPDEWNPDPREPLTATIPLGGDAVIGMSLRLVHTSANRAGFFCDSIDPDSVAHLRRLLELNLDDAELVERELSALG